MSRITIEVYADAVNRLAGIALQDTSASRAAAQVLLSAYNGSEWQLDITDLCVLDQDLYEDALAVIRGRVKLMVEPHTLIEDGSTVFKRIWDLWDRYHVSNRWKSPCFTCNGRGVIVDYDSHDRETRIPCVHCGGTGLVP